MRFLGNIEAKIDVKGRAFLPATFRKVLQEGGEQNLVLRRDVFQPCLVLYPENVWNGYMDELRSRLSRWNGKHQQLYRQFLYDVVVLTPDTNGRILIPKRFLQMANIEQQVKFIGMGDTIELWRDNGDKPFVEPEEFAQSLEEIMSGQSAEAIDASETSESLE